MSVSTHSSNSSLSGSSDDSKSRERETENEKQFNVVSRTITVSRNVIVRYGPYMYDGVLDYRTERLHGIQSK